MIPLGQIVFDDKKGQINLELTSMVEDNLRKEEDERIAFLWEEMASLIENALSKVK